MSNVSGLAATIRNATESETFDLAGSNATTIENIIRDAFTEPFHLSDMIRLTFITGAGKLGRAKYDEHAARSVTSTLRDIGYNEDRAASSVMDCAGTYKLQHDTGKNLKTVVVFPKMSPTVGSIQTSLANTGISDSLIADDSIEHKLAHTTMNVFPKMIESKCEMWSQKKGCLNMLNQLKELAQSLDTKVMNGKPLSDPEQEYYNSVSLSSLEEKINCVRDLMTKQVDSGNITTDEKKQLLQQVSERIQSLNEEINDAEKDNKLKRVETLKAQLVKSTTRQNKIQSITTILPPKLKNEDAILKLRKEMIPLLEIEQSSKGRLLTLKESQSIARKDEIIEEIRELETSSKSWFESDEMFEARVKVSKMNCDRQLKQLANKKASSSSKASSSTSSSSTGTKWVLPTAKKTSAWNNNKPVKKSIPTGNGLFAAMMNDSDSD